MTKYTTLQISTEGGGKNYSESVKEHPVASQDYNPLIKTILVQINSYIHLTAYTP